MDNVPIIHKARYRSTMMDPAMSGFRSTFCEVDEYHRDVTTTFWKEVTCEICLTQDPNPKKNKTKGVEE